jgi:Phage terminase, small subunit
MTLPCPRHLTGVARATWRAVVTEMMAAGTLGADNGRVIERYCVLYARWRAELHLAEDGPITRPRRAPGRRCTRLGPAFPMPRPTGWPAWRPSLALRVRKRLACFPGCLVGEDRQSGWAALKALQGSRTA